MTSWGGIQLRVLIFLWGAHFMVGSASGATEQSIGFYSRGKLVSETTLSLEGPGWLKLFQPRDRGHGALELVELVESVAGTIRSQFPRGERLQIGDISGLGGGAISGHASHQNGLDVDIAYFRKNFEEQNPQSTNGFQEIFVKAGKLTSNFDLDRNAIMISLFAKSPMVTRIFMDPVIKKWMCSRLEADPSQAEILRKLRPISNHADHIHVRLGCPAQSPQCIAQEPPPAGSGCSNDLHDRDAGILATSAEFEI